ncbi:MAG: metallophosphoesterase family protein [Saprospiraceae bacterium]|nr:metallophosphoesterase family protein [Saprospiraceae bacterium]
MKIGLLSDTHGYFDSKLNIFFSEVQQIWHAGDLGNIEVYESLSKIAQVRLVFGNIDSNAIRQISKEFLMIEQGQTKVLMTHIAGSFQNYNPKVRELIQIHQPNVLVCGHSHILKIAFDKKFNLLYINPGAYGLQGIHKHRTALRFNINQSGLSDMEILELPKKKIDSSHTQTDDTKI